MRPETLARMRPACGGDGRENAPTTVQSGGVSEDQRQPWCEVSVVVVDL